MRRTTLVILGLAAAGAALAPGARAQGGRTLDIGGTTVVLARSGGRYQGAPVRRTTGVPQFRALSGETRSAILRGGQEQLAVAAPGAALNRLAELPGGVTLVTASPARSPRPAGPRATSPAFRPLTDEVKAAILKGVASADPGAAPAEPAQPAAESPFTLTPMAMIAVGRGFIHITEPQYVGGDMGHASFVNGKGFVKVATAGVKGKQYMLHFQVWNPTRATYDYSILTGDGTVTKVSAKSGGGAQDIVVMLTLSDANPFFGTTLADIRGGTPEWYFIGVEVTPM